MRFSPCVAVTSMKSSLPYPVPMTLQWEQLNVDTTNPVVLGRWWAEALGWVVVNDAPEEYEIRPDRDRLPGLLFAPVPESKAGKNRLHLDFRPDDQEAEVARLLKLGARRVDVGQGEQPWVVLADPEGNEFCVLGARGGPATG
ncbi:VOC family protein [Streptomyces marokkonensis]|uniref:VOC family protein n=2 Tax=Streptomyces marokkonensis TaxID=324855 RepID=A0ABP7QTW5_9ACTN